MRNNRIDFQDLFKPLKFDKLNAGHRKHKLQLQHFCSGDILPHVHYSTEPYATFCEHSHNIS